MYRSPVPSVFSFLWPIIRPYRSMVWKTLGVLIVSSASILGMGKGLEFLINSVNSQGSFIYAVLVLCIFTLCLAGSSYGRLYWVSRLAELIMGDLQNKIFTHLSLLDLRHFEDISSTDVVARLSSDMNVFQVIVSRIFPLGIRNALIAFGGVFFLFTTSPSLTWRIMLIIPFLFLPLWYYGKKIRRMSQKTQAAQAQISQYIEETFSNMAFVHTFMRHTFLHKHFKKLILSARDISLKRVKYRAIMTMYVILFLFGGVSIILGWGLMSVRQGNLSAGELSSFMFYALAVVVSAASLSEFYGDFQRVVGILSRQMSLLNRHPTIFHGPIKGAKDFKGHIEFRNVDFFYPSRPEIMIFKRANFILHPGEKIAIVGESGVGKSTIFSLILRLYEPCKGSIFLDDIPLSDWNLHTLRRYIGLVPQEPLITSGSLRENIVLDEEASEEDLQSSCQQAQLHTLITQLPQGLDTYTGIKGARLSSGQKQRLALARAFLRQSKIFLFDEITSNLDREREEFIQKNLLSLPQTVLINTHRVTTIQAVDRVLFLHPDKGAMLETHKTLSQKENIYEKLLQLNSAL